MKRKTCVYDHNNSSSTKQWIFYIAVTLAAASALLVHGVAANGTEDETGTKAPSTGSAPGGKKVYQSAYHHVRPGHSGSRGPSSDSSSEGISWAKILVIAVLMVCAVVFIVVVCAYWGRQANEEAMTERQAAVTRFLKMQDQQV